ncbi:uncharacterized protein IAS62_004062 [Cryptococcus decagattii]|uniref:Anthranilate synthase n=1 Tax=Cryptococcus decagattii TaxID=1859122 RepID=A0ABZ2AZT2_9TREE
MDISVLKPTPSLEELTNLFATPSSSTTTLTSRSTTLFPTPNAEPSKPVEPAKPNLIPVYVEIPADLLTPVSAYLKIAKDEKYSYLLESVVGGESLARYSFVGSNPFKTIKTGAGEEVEGDPLKALEKELEPYRFAKIPEISAFTGGAVGFITYDAINHFEPVTTPAIPLHNPIPGMPEACFMLFSTNIIFDHIYQTVKIVSHVYLPDGTTTSEIPSLYDEASARIDSVRRKLMNPETPMPPQGHITLGNQSESNVGKVGYEGFVTKLKEHIVKGDIIQAVPSQRLTRETALHPFNVYRHLRRVNPSPYMFYLDCGDIRLVGASPETLCKVEGRKVYNHAIAGTVKRGKTEEEDAILGAGLLASDKDRAEHIMLVDLARNDVNRFSHVIHLTSQISGILRDDQSRFDAFRSIFPAGTVSGAPKIKAIQLISGLEKERRGVYAGAVGRFDFDRDNLDTCIAIRTMTFKDGKVFLQAGGGIVFDSVEEDEFVETINKLGANVKCIEEAEKYYARLQGQNV